MVTTKEKSLISDELAAQFFWKLADLNAVPLITWNFDGTLITTNDAYLQLVGYSREDFEKGNVNWRDLTPKEYLQLDEQCIKELEAKGVAKPYEKFYLRKDGKKTKIRLYNASVKDKDQKNKAVAIILPIE